MVVRLRTVCILVECIHFSSFSCSELGELWHESEKGSDSPSQTQNPNRRSGCISQLHPYHDFILPSSPILKMCFLSTGCKVESIFLNVEAVNTHRDKPEVRMFFVCFFFLTERT